MSSEEPSREVTAAVISELEQAIGADNVTTGDLERISYSHDLAPLPNITSIAFKNMPDVVCRPTGTEDVQRIVQIADKYSIPITPRGNATWGLGGAMPCFGGIVIDATAKMNDIVEIDKENLFVKCQAGATWKEVYDACMKQGLLLGCYPTSFPSATIGGWISTSGVGIGGYKYGSARDNIRNLEVVMPNGKVVSTGYDKVCNNMTGFNIGQLITGAEGTLGVVCTVTLDLQPGPEVMKPLSYSFDNIQDLGDPIKDICHSRVTPLHIGYLDGNHYRMQKQIGMHVPDVGGLLWIMLEGDADAVAADESKLDAIIEKHGGKKMSQEISEHEWSERCYEFRIREVGIGSIPGEVVVPVPRFAEMATAAYQLLNELKMEGAQIGMVADRNTVMFMPYFTMDAEDLIAMTSYAFNMKLADISAEMGGHGMGFGIFFAAFLPQVAGAAAADTMRDIKTAIDPKDIMNPGKLVAAKTRFGLKLTEGLMEVGKSIMVIGKKVLPESKVFEKSLASFNAEKADREKQKYHTKD